MSISDQLRFLHQPDEVVKRVRVYVQAQIKLESSHEMSKLPVADEFKNKSARI